MMDYNFGLLDENTKREIRRAILKAISIPGYQVSFASREMPMARGWGTGGLQLTLSVIGTDDCLKVIDQGSDESVNAISIKKLIQTVSNVNITTKTSKATIIQSRHRIPEESLNKNQILILQVPIPEPLRDVEPSEYETRLMHSKQQYSGAWLMLFEQIIKYGNMKTGADHPVIVNNRYVMSPSPIPKYDNCKLNMSDNLILFGAGREKKIYAIPPYTKVESLEFDDVKFEVENFNGAKCELCGAENVFFDEIRLDDKTIYHCNDTSYCLERVNNGKDS